MRREIILSMALCLCAFKASGGINRRLTPGEVNKEMTRDVICSKGFGTSDWRDVSHKEKREVMRSYGLPWEKHKEYEFDHLIPLELGGSNGIKNIWPEPWKEARKKDGEENRLHEKVCKGEMDLRTAQYLIKKEAN